VINKKSVEQQTQVTTPQISTPPMTTQFKQTLAVDDDVIVGGSSKPKMNFRQKPAQRWLKIRIWHSRCPVELAIDNAKLQWEGNVDPVTLAALSPVKPEQATVIAGIQDHSEAI